MTRRLAFLSYMPRNARIDSCEAAAYNIGDWYLTHLTRGNGMSLIVRTGLTLSVFWVAACVLAPHASSGVSLPGASPKTSLGRTKSGQVQLGTVPTDQVRSGTVGGSVHLAPLQSHPHGRAYAAWVAEWWRWALE